MNWERRWHPLRQEWVTITSHRNTRPWLGARATVNETDLPDYVADCYLCPGNARISGQNNADYSSVFVFDNDHPAFSFDAPEDLESPPGIYRNAPARGICRVVCYSPKHNLTLAELNANEIAQVLSCWATQTRELGSRKEIKHVLIFENKGEIVGVSNPHPHCQIYAADFVYKTIETEMEAMKLFGTSTGQELFSAILETEIDDGRRLVAGNTQAIGFIPYFARFPYETYVAPMRPCAHLFDLDEAELAGFAEVLRETLVRLDNLWEMSFPYMLVVHQAPTDGADYSDYHCHIQIHPPLRQPGLQKFLAGVETGGGHYLNDKSPEDAAAELRNVEIVHYRHR